MASQIPGGIAFAGLRAPSGGFTGGMAGLYCYWQSKLANLLYAAELARRYPQLTTTAIHPGAVKTEMLAEMTFWAKALAYVLQLGRFKTPAEGAWNQLWASTAPREQVQSGTYYEPVGVKGGHIKASKDKDLQAELWRWTQEQLEEYKAE